MRGLATFALCVVSWDVRTSTVINAFQWLMTLVKEDGFGVESRPAVPGDVRRLQMVVRV